jgi:ribonuclease HI
VSDDRLAAEPLSPLAERVDEVLARVGYELDAAIDAIDAAVPGFGGLFDPNTSTAALRTALDEVLASDLDRPPIVAADAEAFVLYVDGSSRGNPGPAGAGAVILDADEEPLARLGRPAGSHAGNNVAEYVALHLGLSELSRRYDPQTLEVRIDSMTVIRDLWQGEDPTEAGVDGYSDAIAILLAGIPTHRYTHLADSDPNPADALATVGADIAALGP